MKSIGINKIRLTNVSKWSLLKWINIARPGRRNLKTSEKKLRELILYICNKSKNHKRFGMVKLNKILFFADFASYARLGKSISKADYFRNLMGPTPRKINEVFQKMMADGLFKIEIEQINDMERHRPIALRESNVELFSEEELKIVDEIIELLKDKSADEVSKLSHEYIGYKLVKLNEDIPYYTVFCQEQKPQKLSEKVIKKMNEITAKYNY